MNALSISRRELLASAGVLGAVELARAKCFGGDFLARNALSTESQTVDHTLHIKASPIEIAHNRSKQSNGGPISAGAAPKHVQSLGVCPRIHLFSGEFA
jgi:hypothetical protein